MDEISDITKDIMSGGTDFIQTTIWKESLALWAKTWTTEFPYVHLNDKSVQNSKLDS